MPEGAVCSCIFFTVPIPIAIAPDIRDNKDMEHVILASASPRRRELMEQAGIPCTILPAKGEEDAGDRTPAEAVRYLSEQKAREVADQAAGDAVPGTVVIGADTVVAVDSRILGKPADRADAAQMLRLLSGRTHEVFTGVTLVILRGNGQTEETGFVSRTEVDVSALSEDEIAAYLATGEADDKAGAYGIQGRFAIHVASIRGDYYNVVGLPIAQLYRTLRDHQLI